MDTTLTTTTRGDLVVLHYTRFLAAKKDELPEIFKKDFVFTEKESVKEFQMEEPPIGPALMTLQMFDVHPSQHEILVNGKPLRNWHFPQQKVEKFWFSWTEVIPEGFLNEGPNKITIRRQGEKEAFLIRDVIINWHERMPI